MPRNVTLICGPPGSGKSSLGAKLHANVLELEDFDERAETQRGRSKLFGRAVSRVGRDADADVAVIRCAPSLEERERFAAMCRATQTIVLDVDAVTCSERVGIREVIRPGALDAINDWWAIYGDQSVSA